MKFLFKGVFWWFFVLVPGTVISFLAHPPLWGLAWIVPTFLIGLGYQLREEKR